MLIAFINISMIFYDVFNVLRHQYMINKFDKAWKSHNQLLDKMADFLVYEYSQKHHNQRRKMTKSEREQLK